MHPNYLTLLLLLPTTFADVDCRTACHSCLLKEHSQPVLEIYCSMCDECKQRRKEHLMMQIGRTKEPNDADPTSISSISTTTENILSFVHQNLLYDQQPLFSNELRDREGVEDFHEISRQRTTQFIPEGCPTAPPCSDEEEEPPPVPPTITTTTTTSTTTTTTTTTTTPRPCPPIKPCKKKPMTTPMPCCPVPLPPPLPCAPPPIPCGYPVSPPPCYNQPPCGYLPQYPFISYPLPLIVLPSVTSQAEAPPSTLVTAPEEVFNVDGVPVSISKAPTTVVPTSNPGTTDGEYIYMYVGVPKNVMRKGRRKSNLIKSNRRWLN